MNQMTQNPGVTGVGCYADGAQVIGQCKHDGQYYCTKHGEGGYCQKCIEQAHASTPGGVGCVVSALYGLAALIVLMMLAFGAGIGGMFSSGSQANSGGNALGGLIGAVVLGVVYLVVIGLPLFLMGRALSNGSTGTRTFIVIIAWFLVILVPTVVGPIIGGVILFTFNQQPIQHWFEMRKIKRAFSR